MKKTLQISMFLLIVSAYRVSAQQINAKADFAQPVNEVVCEGLTVTLTASTDAGGGLVYDPDKYEWIDVTNGNTQVAETSNTLVLNGLLPGMHTFRVRGTVTSESTCTGEFEEFTFYVLPALDVTVASSGDANGNIFCSDELPLTIQLTAAVTPKTTVSEVFGYTYQWYKVEGGTATAISGATSSTYTVNALALGTATYKVVSAYRVDGSCAFDSSAAGAGAVNIVVKPRPVKPTITFTKS